MRWAEYRSLLLLIVQRPRRSIASFPTNLLLLPFLLRQHNKREKERGMATLADRQYSSYVPALLFPLARNVLSEGAPAHFLVPSPFLPSIQRVQRSGDQRLPLTGSRRSVLFPPPSLVPLASGSEAGCISKERACSRPLSTPLWPTSTSRQVSASSPSKSFARSPGGEDAHRGRGRWGGGGIRPKEEREEDEGREEEGKQVGGQVRRRVGSLGMSYVPFRSLFLSLSLFLSSAVKSQLKLTDFLFWGLWRCWSRLCVTVSSPPLVDPVGPSSPSLAARLGLVERDGSRGEATIHMRVGPCGSCEVFEVLL